VRDDTTDTTEPEPRKLCSACNGTGWQPRTVTLYPLRPPVEQPQERERQRVWAGRKRSKGRQR